MKALVYTSPNEVTYRDEPDPLLAAGEVVLRIDAVGICGSDMHACLRATVAALQRGAFGDSAWVDEWLLAEGARAFRDLHEGRSAGAKIVLHP